MLNPPGEILMYDETANLILPRELYKGRGTGGEGVTNKLRLVWSVFLIFLKKSFAIFAIFCNFFSCYLLQKMGKDHNTWFRSCKDNFEPKEINFSSFGFAITDEKSDGANFYSYPHSLDR